uniref:30S ribosomal protein S9, chloroplastic n=1 Tax=Eucampia antarctica TaxID=49252 RepID=A0A7S2R062_9STRA|mmetsp:Transcript_10883/g.10392  ORF Transcript_10883/g.10392 Transcript_10883/m.10392 type:complete len:351 (+) Transcript_10883:33-1085(+)
MMNIIGTSGATAFRRSTALVDVSNNLFRRHCMLASSPVASSASISISTSSYSSTVSTFDNPKSTKSTIPLIIARAMSSNQIMKKHNSSNNNNPAGRRGSNANNNNFPNPRLRTHAISILDGNYEDYDDLNSSGEEHAFQEGDDDWKLVEDGEGYHDTDNNNSNSGNSGRGDSNPMMYKSREEEEKEQRIAKQVLEAQTEEQEQKDRWIQNAKTPVREVQVDERGRSYGRGGRKTSTARVWIQPGDGVITVNRRPFVHFFPRESDRELILGPFVATQTCGNFDMMVTVEGGGVTGKAGAIRHGLARALENYNPDYRPPMKRLGFMTRDARMVERKKIGLKKARKAPQWVRR